MPQVLKRYLRYTSWPIIVSMLALIVLGVLAIDAAERASPSLVGHARKQVQFACVALGAFLVASMVPYPRIGRLAYPLFAITLGLLVLVFFMRDIHGTHRWIGLGDFRVQPSEIAKLTYIILLAWYLRSRSNYRSLRGLIPPFVLTFIPMGLVLVEPDLGTSLLFLPTLYVMLFMAGAKLRHLVGIIVVATAVLLVPVVQKVTPQMSQTEIASRRSLAYFTVDRQQDTPKYLVVAAPLVGMEARQITRITGWFDQEGHQLQRSKTVLGSGGLTGRDEWSDSEDYFRMLTYRHTDFIFAVIGGEWGFVGCIFVLLLYGVIFIFGIEIATITYDPFGRLLGVGVLALLASQICINVGMTMGMMPITGMTLPLVSYGGSSLVVNCAALGMLVNVGRRGPVMLGRRPFEYDNQDAEPTARYGTITQTTE